MAAAAALYTLPRADNNQELLAVYFILQIFQPLTLAQLSLFLSVSTDSLIINRPIVFSWAFANTAGHTKKTTTTVSRSIPAGIYHPPIRRINYHRPIPLEALGHTVKGSMLMSQAMLFIGLCVGNVRVVDPATGN